MSSIWSGITDAARSALTSRDYKVKPLIERLKTSGVSVKELLCRKDTLTDGWIPGVSLIPRKIYRQPFRGYFGEFIRENNDIINRIGLWPKQWATATMFAGTSKGFHIHPPYIPEGQQAEKFIPQAYDNNGDYIPKFLNIDKEQWDIMFFTKGTVEMILIDERMGMERRIMRFTIDGDNVDTSVHAGVIIPAGVAHALRVEGSEDLVMVYGTSTTFNSEFEGRIASGVETCNLPQDWEEYINI